MSIESVTGPDGAAAPLMARFGPEAAVRTRPGREEDGAREAAQVRRDEAADRKDPVSRVELERLVEEVNTNLGLLNEKLGFQVHEGTGQLVVQIVDRKSGEVVRESPPREFLDLAARMREMVGLFLDEQG